MACAFGRLQTNKHSASRERSDEVYLLEFVYLQIILRLDHDVMNSSQVLPEVICSRPILRSFALGRTDAVGTAIDKGILFVNGCQMPPQVIPSAETVT